jgi:hypothetical protein
MGGDSCFVFVQFFSFREIQMMENIGARLSRSLFVFVRSNGKKAGVVSE